MSGIMNTAILDAFVEDLRSKRQDPRDVPGFDPTNGNINAKVLLVLEAPGPRAVKSKRVSIENEDPTARNLKKLLTKTDLKPEDLIIWNVVPWYCGNDEKTKIVPPSSKDLTAGIGFLCQLIGLLPNLKSVVLVGGTARKAHVRLSATTDARILSCHHMSQRVYNSNSAAAEENEAVFSVLGRIITC
jgi:uracil-DNA glycosylase